ncbi:MAG TPA: class I SAM-dependent methyltransferase [Kofleriaceae bacterium]|nr:class I SAM-dependent methyltransferase [Kofleriaceae bacterium]
MTDNYVGQDLEALADIPNYQNWILRHFREHLHGRVLEIGAGIGSLSARYRSDVDSAVLLEPAQNLIGPLRERFTGDRDVTVLGKILGDAIADGDLAHGSFDAVVLINVLEHVDDDAGMLADIYSLLKPGGTLLLFVPALQWLFGSLDSLVSHLRRYAKPELRELVQQAGFSIRDLRYFDVLGVLPWYVTGRIIKAREFNARAARIYDTLGVPVGSFVERFAAPPLGKNLLAIAQRSRD